MIADPDPYGADPQPGDATSAHEQLVEYKAREIRIERDARRKVDLEEIPPAPPFDIGTVRQMLARQNEPPFQIDGVLPSQSAMLLVAQRKIGKSTLVGNLADSLLTGEPFLGRFATVPTVGRVAVLNYEVNGTQLANWYHDMGVDPDRVTLVNLRGRRNPLSHPADRLELASTLQGHSVVVCDPFGRAFTGRNQNDPGEVQTWLMEFDAFSRSEVGASLVVLCAHAGWNGERSRGASSLEDWADVIVTVTRNDEGDRYLRAIGRDVDIEEDRLSFDPVTRRITMSGEGSRKMAAATARQLDHEARVVTVLREHAGSSASEILRLLKEDGEGLRRPDLTRALTRLVGKGLVLPPVTRARGAKHYTAVDNGFPVPRPLQMSPPTGGGDI